MHSLKFTALFSAILTILVLVLAYRVVIMRRRHRVGVGDGRNKELQRAIGAHQNAVENISIMLLLLGLYEFNQGSTPVLALIGTVFVVARLLNAWGVSRVDGMTFGRYWGTVVSWLSMALLAVMNAWLALA